MSAIIRPFTRAENSPNAAALSRYHATDTLDHNAAYYFGGWMRLGQYYGYAPRGFFAHVGRAGLYGSMDLLQFTGPPEQNEATRPTFFFGWSNTEGDNGGLTATANEVTGSFNLTAGPAWKPQTYTDPAFWYRWNHSPDSFNWGIGPWFHLALVREDATTVTQYVNGVRVATFNHVAAGYPALTRSAANLIVIGGRYIGTNIVPATGGVHDATPHDGKYAYWRVITGALSQADVQAEMNTTISQHANVWADWPLTADYNDISGAARHLSIHALTPSVGAANEVYLFDADVPSGPVDPTPPVAGDPFDVRARLGGWTARVQMAHAMSARVQAAHAMTARLRALPITPEE